MIVGFLALVLSIIFFICKLGKRCERIQEIFKITDSE